MATDEFTAIWRGGERLLCAGLYFPAIEDPGAEKNMKEVAVQFAIFDRQFQNIQGAFNGDGLLVWAVGGGKGVKNVGDRHHAGLYRNLRRKKLVRIAGAVQLLMVSARDLGYVAQLVGPGDLLQKADGVDHMRLYLHA